MVKKIEIRKCLYSGEEFIPKRNNQVFASKKNRSNYHNEINNKLRNELKFANNQLLKNYKICIDLLGKKRIITVHKEFLKGKGFDFKFFTNIAESNSKSVIAYTIYNITFEKLDNENYIICKI